MAPSGSLSTRNLVTLVSIMVLVGTEVFGVAIAAGWAIAGLFELGDLIGYVLMGAFSLLALWIMVNLWQRATSIEPIRTRR
ncbi:hypothetical protein GMJLKIPL_2698 [Methylobacterium isbiliense]|uniref:Signaling protein n=2 Tax=Methylobacterium isbiliense TaxID=315478 RepID=A0ABQ4SCL4_9HYPH|nr:hypothetical protein GMJLKIPL_2698 [Methylobacterium isbiliense]